MQPFPGRFRGPSRREGTDPIGRSLPAQRVRRLLRERRRYRGGVRRRAASSLAPLALLCALLAGCGGGGADGRAVLDRTLDRLGRIGSGDLHGSLLLTPRGIG